MRTLPGQNSICREQKIPVCLLAAAFQQAAVFVIREVFICTFAMTSVSGYNGGAAKVTEADTIGSSSRILLKPNRAWERFPWWGASLLPEERTGAGCSAICEALLHPVVRHRNTASRITAILDFIRFTPFDYILPDDNRSDKDAFWCVTFYHIAGGRNSKLCDLRASLR